MHPRMAERVCENCGFPDDELILVRRVYVVPETWDQPWTAETAWSKVDGPIFEYACHEGNYSLRNTLHGARVLQVIVDAT